MYKLKLRSDYINSASYNEVRNKGIIIIFYSNRLLYYCIENQIIELLKSNTFNPLFRHLLHKPKINYRNCKNLYIDVKADL